MSVSSTLSSVSYSGNASTTAAYVVPFQFFDASDLVVVRNTAGTPTTLVLGTDYSVTGGAGSTGSIVTTAEIASTSTVIITRSTAKTQLTSYTTGDRFPATAQEKALDKLTMLVQEATATAAPPTSTASGTAPYVLQAASVGASPAWVPQSSGGIAAGAITNAMLAGGITPAKLSTGGPTWDASGNLTATSFVGNASTASSAAKLTTPRTLSLSGDVTGTASFDGSANSAIASSLANSAVTTAKIADSAVTASKLGTNEKLQIAKAWANFNGALTGIYSATGVSYSRSGTTVTVTSPSHGLTTGYTITVSSATDTGLNGVTGTVTSTGTNTFTFTTASTGTATGTLNWVLNGAIRSSYNVSSITKNGTGDYTVNFTTAMADANYTVFGCGQWSSFANGDIPLVGPNRSTALTTASVRVNAIDASTKGVGDPTSIFIQVFGN